MTLPSPPDVHRAVPAVPCGTGVLVLAGSSGRVERERADLLARSGAHALAIRWFGGAGQRPAPHEVPLETFFGALDHLQRDCERLAIIGASLGAEAALLTAAHDERVDAVVALAPSSVVWAGYDDDYCSSHWTLNGSPVPYVPLDPEWSPSQEPPAFRTLYEQSFAADDAVTAAARIQVENVRGDVVLIAGGDDQVWPSVESARRIATRRREHNLATTLVVRPSAGHRVVLPESRPAGGTAMARGGTPDADEALGNEAWPHIVRALRLHPHQSSRRQHRR